jgi:hypothetical protein
MMLDAAGLPALRLLPGEGDTCWPLAGHAERLGLPARIGLADATAGPDGDPTRRCWIAWRCRRSASPRCHMRRS